MWASKQVFSIRTRAKSQLGTEAWCQQVIRQRESKDPLGKHAVGVSHAGMGHGKHGLRRGQGRPLSLDLNRFWIKHSGSSYSLKKSFRFVLRHLSLCHLCDVSFYSPCTRTWARFLCFVFFFFFFFLFFWFCFLLPSFKLQESSSFHSSPQVQSPQSMSPAGRRRHFPGRTLPAQPPCPPLPPFSAQLQL